MKNTYNIKEIAELIGKSDTSIYRYIKNGKLLSHTVTHNGKEYLQVKKSDLETFLGKKIDNLSHTVTQNENHMKNTVTHRETVSDNATHNEFQITAETLQEAISQAISQQQSQLMKPLEQQALYKLGAVEKENTFLKARLETVLHENKELQEKIKALPDFEKEKADLLQEERERHRKEIQKQDNNIIEEARKLGAIHQEEIINLTEKNKKQEKSFRQETEEKLKQSEENHRKELKTIRQETEEKHRKELEARQKELEEKHDEELEQIKQEYERTLKLMSESAEKEKMEIVEAWKKKTEELERPWWKFW